MQETIHESEHGTGSRGCSAICETCIGCKKGQKGQKRSKVSGPANQTPRRLASKVQTNAAGRRATQPRAHEMDSMGEKGRDFSGGLLDQCTLPPFFGHSVTSLVLLNRFLIIISLFGFLFYCFFWSLPLQGAASQLVKSGRRMKC